MDAVQDTNGLADLRPVEGRELAVLLDELHRMVERQPASLRHPAVLLSIRLALTVSQGSGSSEALEAAQAALEAAGAGLDRAGDENDQLRRQNLSLVQERDEAQGQVRKLQGSYDTVRAEVKVARRERDQAEAALAEARAPNDALTRKLEAAIQELQMITRMVEGRIDLTSIGPHGHPLAHKIAQALLERDQLQVQMNLVTTEAGSQLDRVREDLARLEAEVATAENRGRQKGKKEGKKTAAKAHHGKVMARFREWEYSAKHRTLTFRGTREHCPCCPYCSGLDPNRVQGGSNVGHQRGCYVANLGRALEALQPS